MGMDLEGEEIKTLQCFVSKMWSNSEVGFFLSNPKFSKNILRRQITVKFWTAGHQYLNTNSIEIPILISLTQDLGPNSLLKFLKILIIDLLEAPSAINDNIYTFHTEFTKDFSCGCLLITFPSCALGASEIFSNRLGDLFWTDFI